MGYKKPTTVRLLGERIKREHHTRLPNGLIRDPDVSANGFRVAAYLLSLDDGFGVNQRGIASATGLTRDAVNSGIKSLVATGWLRKNDYRHEDSGHVYRHEYVMHRSRRMAGNPDHMTATTDDPKDSHMAGNPDHSMAGNPDHLKRNKRDTDTEEMSGSSVSVSGAESGAQAASRARQPLPHGVPEGVSASTASPAPGTQQEDSGPRVFETKPITDRCRRCDKVIVGPVARNPLMAGNWHPKGHPDCTQDEDPWGMN